jgi:hypothetical protein
MGVEKLIVTSYVLIVTWYDLLFATSYGLLSWHLSGCAAENHEIVCRKKQCMDRDLNPWLPQSGAAVVLKWWHSVSFIPILLHNFGSRYSVVETTKETKATVVLNSLRHVQVSVHVWRNCKQQFVYETASCLFVDGGMSTCRKEWISWNMKVLIRMDGCLHTSWNMKVLIRMDGCLQTSWNMKVLIRMDVCLHTSWNMKV